MTYIDPENVELALRILNDGNLFEKFAQSFLSGFLGDTFTPVGGMHDGGVDGFQKDKIFIGTKRKNKFYQISKTSEEGTKEKIKHTIKRIKDTRSEENFSIHYLCPHLIQDKDILEESFFESENIFVKIWDRSFISSNINHSGATRASFEIIRSILLAFEKAGSSNFIPQNNAVSNASVLVLLRQEVESNDDPGGSLIDKLIDTLIIWSLEGTDPDKKIFKSKDDIQNAIVEMFPSAAKWIVEKLTSRLNYLSNKSHPDGKQINHHTKEKNYCLPYQTRRILSEENKVDFKLRENFEIEIYKRCRSEFNGGFSNDRVQRIAKSIVLALQNTYSKEGLAFCEFIENGNAETNYETVLQELDLSLSENELVKDKPIIIDSCEDVIRQVFYFGSQIETEYLRRLAKTYSLLFSLRLDYSVWNYFDELQGQLRLLIGTDIIIRALSERFVKAEKQGTRNLFKILSSSGSELILAEPVLEKIYSHIRTSDYEFNNFEGIEGKILPEIWKNSPKILVRAYFHSKGEGEKAHHPKSWPEFINQFCDYKHLHSPKGKEQIKRYVMSQFKMRFLPNDEVSELINNVDDFEEQVSNLIKIKENESLARASAKVINSIYQLRLKDGEDNTLGIYGYKTWCLSSERRILKKTRKLIKKYGASYLMRPEFLLNFISMAPTHSEIRETFKSVFPSMLGIKLSNRVSPSAYQKLIERIGEAKNYDDGRIESAISEAVDKLKSDFSKDYDQDILNNHI